MRTFNANDPFILTERPTLNVTFSLSDNKTLWIDETDRTDDSTTYSVKMTDDSNRTIARVAIRIPGDFNEERVIRTACNAIAMTCRAMARKWIGYAAAIETLPNL